MHPFIHIYADYKIPTYTVIFLLGFFSMVAIAILTAPKKNIDRFDACAAAAYSLIGIGVGAKLFFFLSKLPQMIQHLDELIPAIAKDPKGFFVWSFGGLVFYGGLIGALVGAYRYCWHYKVSFSRMIDHYIPFFPIIHGIGRIGCFMAGCCYGKEYHGPLAVHFPYNEFTPALSEVPRFPVQLLEAGLNFIMGIILLILANKFKKLREGQLVGIYLCYYLVARIFLEMLRGDAVRGNIGGISFSQIISILLIPVAIFFISGRLEKMQGRAFPK